jgi:hypothetical protein
MCLGSAKTKFEIMENDQSDDEQSSDIDDMALDRYT